MKPRADLLAGDDRSRSSGEDEERRLERILGVVVIAEDPVANAPDHRGVTVDEGLENRLFAVHKETFQKLAIGQPVDRPQAEQNLDLTSRRVQSAEFHREAPVPRIPISQELLPGGC